MKKKWNLYSISQSRAIIMGFATLIVALFHCYSLRYGSVFNFIRNTGNVGVDIFLFVSAIGLYFSFTKNSNVKEFYKKRLLRIFPAIFIVGTIYYCYIRVDFLTYLKNITLISLFTNGTRDLWYFTLTIIMYFLYPILYKAIHNKGLRGLIGLLLIVFGINLLLYNFGYGYYQKIEIALTRVPVFLFGIYAGKQIYEKKEISSLYILLFILMFILTNVILYIGGIKPYMIVRYLYCILGISIVFIIAYVHSLYANKYIDKFLEFFGTYSMEVYLIFEHLSLEVRKLITVHNNIIFYIIMFIITIILSLLLKVICNKIVSLFEKKK